jgi:uncharacterized membrane protein
MKTKPFLFLSLFLMAGLIVYGLAFPDSFEGLLRKPEFYIHAKFLHILCVTLFFANAIIGMIWETRSLLTGDPKIVQHTYNTVVWIDAMFTAPLILLSVVSGIMLGTILGGVWTIGWVSISFVLFFLSGLIWVVADIPTQYKVKAQFKKLAPDASELTPELRRLLWQRMGISLVGTVPLFVILYLMVHKPDLPKVAKLLGL